MTRPEDPALAHLGRIANLLEEAAKEIRNFAGSSRGDLDPLGEVEAECRSSGPEPAAKDPMPTEKPMLMTAAQVAEELQVTPRTLRRMRAAGEGPKPIEVRGARRWRRIAVERWVARRES